MKELSKSFRRTPALLALVCALIGAVRVVSTYHAFNHTFDEPAHIVCGLELVEQGIYYIEPQHPPLSRIAMAIGPYLAGARVPETLEWLFTDGIRVLYDGDRYWTYLTLARLGILPFYFLAVLATWLWARRFHGEWAAAAAVFFLTASPTFLAHSGLATTDVASVSTITLCLYAFCRRVEEPSFARTVALGGAFGLAMAAKFTGGPYLAASFVAFGCAVLLGHGGVRKLKEIAGSFHWKQLAAAAATAVVVMWIVYGGGFSLDHRPIAVSPQIHDRAVAWAPQLDVGRQDRLAAPLPHFISYMARGLAEVARHAREGHHSFYMGEMSMSGGWITYFPVMLLIKTTIPLLVLGFAGLYLLGKKAATNADTLISAPVWFCAAILLVAMSGNINIGVRHILALYPMLSIAAGFAVVELFREQRKIVARVALFVFAGWHLATGAAAHPNYLPYFNFLAGAHPENIVADSNLDWGQELNLACETLRESGIQDYWYGTGLVAEVEHHGCPAGGEEITDGAAVEGLAMISVTWRALEGPLHPWLQGLEPEARIGKTYFLYRVPLRESAP